MTALLELSGVEAWYGRAKILHGVGFSVGSGEVVALMGRNGAGKSTTMKTVMGLVPEPQGSIRFEAKEIAGREPFQIARLGIGYVPEDRRVFSELSVITSKSAASRPAMARRTGRRSVSSTSSPISAACAIGRAAPCQAASSRC